MSETNVPNSGSMTGMRRTKIVATIGPASDHDQTLRELILAGVDVARINFSHGEATEHAKLIGRIQRLSRELNRPVAILQDLCGPKIRVQIMEGDGARLIDGEKTILTTENIVGNARRFGTSYVSLPKDVRTGDRILLDDGKLELEVDGVQGSEVFCTILRGGILKSKKGINLPGVKLSTPSVTEKDLSDLKLGLEAGVDYVALSFVRDPEDILQVRKLVEELGADVRIIAKIEKPEAVDKIEAIVEASDGIMVARGDLGVETPPERIPVLQKQIVTLCNRYDRPVIVATQMLESMMTNLTPNRAEVSDIGNAILDGTDAVMLSGETAAGRYPVAAVQMMARIATEVERYLLTQLSVDSKSPCSYSNINLLLDAIGRAAFRVVEDLGIPLLVTSSSTGETALFLSKSRTHAMILGATDNEAAWRRMNLYWGVVPVLCVKQPGIPKSEFLKASFAEALRLGMACSGDQVAIVTGTPICVPDAVANNLEVLRLP